jgi:paraquat-inducible protein B
MQKYNAPKVKESKGVQGLTTIWLVPFLAMIIALWLAFQYYTKIGPTIEISFKSNAGLIANQSQIKLRDVTIGMVTKISLSNDGKGVIVQASMNKEVEAYLNPKAKLWIVHPDVGSHGVSGLDTLLSGSYIELHGVKEIYTQKKFVGLENPYLDTEAKGKYYLLSAPNSYNITEGSNVYYRMIKVGRVERVGIAPNGKGVNFTIFVEDHCTPFVNNKSQFYSRSNFSIDFSQAKLDMSIASMSQIVHGGVSIYTPLQSLENSEKNLIKKGQVFPIYKSLSEMKSKHLMRGADDKIYKFSFKKSNNKLEIGSPVKFNGYQVGYVTGIESHFKQESRNIQSDIFAIIHTKAFVEGKSENNISGEMIIEQLVHNGLKAKLDSTLPIIGADFIDLIFDNKRNATIQEDGEYALFPTIYTEKSITIIDDVKKLIVKLEKLPLKNLLKSANNLIVDGNKLIRNTTKPIEKILKNLDDVVKNSDKVIKNLNNTINNVNMFTNSEALQNLPNEISNTIQELEQTLSEFQIFAQGYNANSKFSAELSATLRELSLAAESIERVSRKLEKKPNSLLLGDD